MNVNLPLYKLCKYLNSAFWPHWDYMPPHMLPHYVRQSYSVTELWDVGPGIEVYRVVKENRTVQYSKGTHTQLLGWAIGQSCLQSVCKPARTAELCSTWEVFQGPGSLLGACSEWSNHSVLNLFCCFAWVMDCFSFTGCYCKITVFSHMAYREFCNDHMKCSSCYVNTTNVHIRAKNIIWSGRNTDWDQELNIWILDYLFFRKSKRVGAYQ